jgi:hypothetical protein
MKTFRPKPRGWLMPPLSLYWRRRRRPLRMAHRPALPSTTPAPMVGAAPAPVPTFVSIQRHIHRPRHMTRLLSRCSTVTWRLAQPAAALPRVSQRVIVKRIIEARPIDGPEALPAALQPMFDAPRVARLPEMTGGRLFRASRPTAAPYPMTGATTAGPRASTRELAQSTELTHTRRLLLERSRADVTELARTIRTRREQTTDLVRLDWRRTPVKHGNDATPLQTARAPLPSATSATALPTVAATVPTHERTASAGSRVATASVAVDPATVDRLADTVIQRIERRVRIERERRGL